VRIAARTIEVFHHGKRVAAHMRSSSNRRHTTVREHMPSSHRRCAEWTPERIRRQAGEIGRNTAALIEIIMRERSHREQGFRASVGIIRLVKSWGRERLDAACGRALEIGALGQLDSEERPRSQTARSCRGPAVDCGGAHCTNAQMPLNEHGDRIYR
jgi:transposase